MVNDIVVRWVDISEDLYGTAIWRPFMATGFSVVYTVTNEQSDAEREATVEQVVGTGKANFLINKKSGQPKVDMKNVTKDQFDDVNRMLDNKKNDPELAAQFKHMADNDINLVIVVADSLPQFPGSDSRAAANIRYTPQAGNFQGGNQSLVGNTTVEIVVKADRISNAMTWEETFAGIIAHEFTHLKRDDNGVFLKDDEVGAGKGTVYDEDNQTYQNLFSHNTSAGYSNSLDIGVVANRYPNMTTLTGTNGNNKIDLNYGNAVAATTGGGNDIIIGGSSVNETIYIDGAGRKAVVQAGTGYDMLVMETIPSISKLVISYIGSDTYLTSSDSAYVPEQDPNAVVVIGQTRNHPDNAVETVIVANGGSIDLYDYRYWNGMNSLPGNPDVFPEPAYPEDGYTGLYGSMELFLA